MQFLAVFCGNYKKNKGKAHSDEGNTTKDVIGKKKIYSQIGSFFYFLYSCCVLDLNEVKSTENDSPNKKIKTGPKLFL